MTGSNTYRGVNIQNDAAGTGHRFTGFGAFNNADQTEEIRGFQYNTDGDSRTSTGLDIIMTGNTIDDAQGIRINVSGQTSSSTTNHVSSAQFQGGLFSVQSNFTPFAGLGVDIGNGLSVTSTIVSGFPLTGTDQILTFLQSNLIADDDIATGPFGLDTNMMGAVSQVAVASGKTIPLLRSLLLGTSVPTGSGGTITEHVVLEILGLPSFGGSVTCPTKIGIQDSILLGQNFSDGATDIWGIRWRDVNSEHYLVRLALNTASMKVSASNINLEVNGDSYFTGNVVDGSNVTSIDPNTRNLEDSSSVVSVEWGGRRLLSSTGGTAVDWGIYQLRDSSSVVSQDWEGRVSKDSSGNDSVDWENRLTVDSSGNQSINWDDRTLRNTDTDIVARWDNADQIFELFGHLNSNAASPTVAADANAGTGATATVARATDIAGEATLNTGTVGIAAGAQVTVTFAQAYVTVPIVTLQPVNANAATAEATLGVYVTATTTDFTINFNVAGVVLTTYVWNYHAIETT
jgi:hypothetical protein